MQKDANALYKELQETYDNLGELYEDGYDVKTSQIIAATYSKVGYLQAIVHNNPDFLYKRDLLSLVERIDFFFGIKREKEIVNVQKDK